MKRAVWKSVDERDIQTFAGKKRAKVSETIALEQLTRVARAEPEPEPEWNGWRQSPLQLRRDFPDRAERRLPAVCRVDVGAVGEVKRRIGSQQHADGTQFG
jgi:hypothetical protein